MAGGDVLLDKISAKKLGLNYFRNRVAVVLADDKLLAGTIAENICLFDPEPDLELIEFVVKQAGLWDEANQLPMRLFTIVGDMGNALSSAQKFKICLARSLYRKPDFLVLDNAFNGWGQKTRDALLTAILSVDIGIVMTARMGDTPSCATQILHLANGKLLKPVLPEASSAIPIKAGATAAITTEAQVAT